MTDVVIGEEPDWRLLFLTVPMLVVPNLIFFWWLVR